MMNRARSIKDIGSIYLQMQKAASTINEAAQTAKKSQKVKAKFPADTFQKSGKPSKEPNTFKEGGPENVKGLKKGKLNKKFSQKGKKTKKINEDSINNFMSIFDKLYEDVMKDDQPELDKGINMGPEGDLGDEEAGGFGGDEFGGDDLGVEATGSPKELLEQAIDLLQQAVAALGDEDESEDESDDDLEALGVDSEEGDEVAADEDEEDFYAEEDVYETTEIEKLPTSAGHKLTKGSNKVGGAIKTSSGKADASVTDEVGTETGKHPLQHKSELTNPSKNKVGTLKTGKSLFDQ